MKQNEVFMDTPEQRLKVDSSMTVIKQLSAVSIDSALINLDAIIANYKLEGFDYGYARAISLKSWYLNFEMKYEEGLALGHEALEIQRELNDSLGLGNTYNRLGLSNLYFERSEESKKYLLKAFDYFTILNDTTQIEVVLNNLGVLSSEIEHYEEAIDYYKQSLKLRQLKKKFFWVAYSYYNIAESYSSLNKMDSVTKYFELSLYTFKNKSKGGKVPAMVYDGLAKWNLETEDYRQAIHYGLIALEKAHAKKNKEMTFAATRTLVEAYSGIRDFEKAFNYQTSSFEQQQRFDSLNNVVKVAEIEEKFNNSEKQRQITELKNKNLANKKKIFDLYWLAGYSILIILTGAPVLYFLNQRKKQKRALQKETVDKQLAEIKLMALQAQMNPHFVFNCINTAQSFVLNDKKQEAYVYLTNFAKLLRSVLIHSSKAYIPLEDEIDQLKLYIELEAIRFDEHFDYDIQVDPALEQGIFEVPGMIIQSFVENAILHGLNNLKTKTGHLTVSFHLQEDLLKCEIIDNGIGRKAAQVIKEQKKAHYPSAALPNISERIQLMRDITGRKVDISIIDLEKNGSPAGTKVQLFLPIQ